MDATGEPDDVTEAAIEVVSEATELAQDKPLGGRVLRGRVLRRRRGRRRGADSALASQAAPVTGVRRLGAAIGGTARRGVLVTGRRMSAGGRWLSDQVLAMAPRLPVRSQQTLRAQFPGQSPDQLAESLIQGAAKASATVGVAVGAWAVLPVLPAAGVEIATETLAVVGIEIKLVAELHEVYGMVPDNGVMDRMTAYVGAWAQRRGVALAPGGIVLAAGSPLARQLQRRLAARAGRSVFSLGPLLTGAVAGGLLNRRETRKLGRLLRDDLRKRSPYRGVWPAEAPPVPPGHPGHPGHPGQIGYPGQPNQLG